MHITICLAFETDFVVSHCGEVSTVHCFQRFQSSESHRNFPCTFLSKYQLKSFRFFLATAYSRLRVFVLCFLLIFRINAETYLTLNRAAKIRIASLNYCIAVAVFGNLSDRLAVEPLKIRHSTRSRAYRGVTNNSMKNVTVKFVSPGQRASVRKPLSKPENAI